MIDQSFGNSSTALAAHPTGGESPHAVEPPGPPRRIRPLAILAILAILWTVGAVWGFWALEFYRHAQGRFPAFDPDTVLYRRWVEQSIDRGAPIATDTYQCFPEVYHLQFPPFYLRSLLFFVWVFFAMFPGATVDPEFVVGFLPVLAMIFLNALLLWRFWRTSRSVPFCAFLAVASFPGFPQNITYTFLGLDHHWLETSCIWVTLVAAAEFHDSRRPWWKILCGLVTAIFIGTWMGSPIWHAVVTLYVTILWIAGAWERFEPLAELAGSAMTIGGGLLLIYLAIHPPMRQAWVIYQFSWLQPMLAVFAGIWCLGLRNWAPRTAWGRKLALGVVVGGGLGLLYAGSSFQPLEEARTFIFRKNYLIQTIGEMQPLVRGDGPATAPENLKIILLRFGVSFFFLPLMFFPDARKIFRGGNFVLRDVLLLFLGLTFFQVRYGRWLAAGVGMLAGAVQYQMVKLLRQGLAETPRRHWYVAMVMVPMLYVQMAVQLGNNWTQADRSPDFLEALNWIQERTPPTSGYSDDQTLPEYGILSFWDKGNYIPFIGRRPAVVANSGLGYRRQAEILTAESEEEAYDLFKRNRVRYFLIAQDAMKPSDHDYMNLLKRQPKGDALVDMTATIIPATASWRPYHEGFDAWVRQGMTFIPTGAFSGAPAHFRWVYLSRKRSGALPVVRLLEAVAGARLLGTGDPGSPFEVHLPMRFDQFDVAYTATGTLDAAGRLDLRVPYATSHFGGRVQTQARYRVRFAREARPCESLVEVPETAIQEGTSIEIPTPVVASWGWPGLR